MFKIVTPRGILGADINPRNKTKKKTLEEGITRKNPGNAPNAGKSSSQQCKPTRESALPRKTPYAKQQRGVKSTALAEGEAQRRLRAAGTSRVGRPER